MPPIRCTQSYMQAGGRQPQTQVHLPMGCPMRVSLPLPEVWVEGGGPHSFPLQGSDEGALVRDPKPLVWILHSLDPRVPFAPLTEKESLRHSGFCGREDWEWVPRLGARVRSTAPRGEEGHSGKVCFGCVRAGLIIMIHGSHLPFSLTFHPAYNYAHSHLRVTWACVCFM